MASPADPLCPAALAVRHTERNVAETGLELLQDLLGQFAQSSFCTAFHQVG